MNRADRFRIVHDNGKRSFKGIPSVHVPEGRQNISISHVAVDAYIESVVEEDVSVAL